MEELKIFENAEFGKVRVVKVDGDPWFVARDIATALGYMKPENAVSVHVSEEDKITTLIQGTGSNYKSSAVVINESGLYSLILSSKLPTAKQFKRWVTAEVLPSIRKHGMYAVDQLISNPDLAIQAFTALKEEREQRKALESQIEKNAPKVLFADAVAASHTSILTGELAKLLKQNGVEIGQNRLFAWLRDNGYLIRRKGSDYNMPTQKSMEMGLFEVKERTIHDPNGSVRVIKTPKVTGKGQQYFINKFLGVPAQ